MIALVCLVIAQIVASAEVVPTQAGDVIKVLVDGTVPE